MPKRPLTATSITKGTMATDMATKINLIAEYLANPEVTSLTTPQPPADCLVLCASSVLHHASTTFHALQSHPSITKTLILCGGIGHSTTLLYDAIATHPKYHSLSPAIKGLPEARVLEMLMNRYFDPSAIRSAGCQILIEDQSTNCGSNAIETRKVLDKAGIIPQRCIIVQDPTMSLRTKASFVKAFEDIGTGGGGGGGGSDVTFLTYPVFTPQMRYEGSGAGLVYDVPGVPDADMWSQQRFLELIMGEIPRLRDDEVGYGPRGKGFIAHVDVPERILDAWRGLQGHLGVSER